MPGKPRKARFYASFHPDSVYFVYHVVTVHRGNGRNGCGRREKTWGGAADQVTVLMTLKGDIFTGRFDVYPSLLIGGSHGRVRVSLDT